MRAYAKMQHPVRLVVFFRNNGLNGLPRTPAPRQGIATRRLPYQPSGRSGTPSLWPLRAQTTLGSPHLRPRPCGSSDSQSYYTLGEGVLESGVLGVGFGQNLQQPSLLLLGVPIESPLAFDQSPQSAFQALRATRKSRTASKTSPSSFSARQCLELVQALGPSLLPWHIDSRCNAPLGHSSSSGSVCPCAAHTPSSKLYSQRVTRRDHKLRRRGKNTYSL